MKHIFIVPNEFAEFVILAIHKKECINPRDSFVLSNQKKHIPRYLGEAGISIINANFSVFSNPTLRNIVLKIKSTKKFIFSALGKGKYILYLPYLSANTRLLITKRCAEIRIFEEGFEAVDFYSDYVRHPVDILSKYSNLHILKAAVVCRSLTAIWFYLNAHRINKTIVTKAFKYTPIAYDKLSGDVCQIDLKHQINFIFDSIIKREHLARRKGYIVILSELFVNNLEDPSWGFDLQSLAGLKNRFSHTVDIYYKGRLKDKSDGFETARSIIPGLKKFPEKKDILLEMKIGNVCLVIGGISSLLLLACQLNCEIFVCPNNTKHSGLVDDQKRLLSYIKNISTNKKV